MNINQRRFLKIKLMSLAAESRIIRNEETRMKARIKQLRLRDKDDAAKGLDAERELMHEHRIKDVRDETRATHIAYGYLRGRPFRQIEPNGNWNTIKWNRVESMIQKYGNPAD